MLFFRHSAQFCPPLGAFLSFVTAHIKPLADLALEVLAQLVAEVVHVGQSSTTVWGMSSIQMSMRIPARSQKACLPFLPVQTTLCT